MDQWCCEMILSDVVEVLFESDEDGMTGFSNIVFMAGGAGNDVYDVCCFQGEGAEDGEASLTVMVVYEFSGGVVLVVRCVWCDYVCGKLRAYQYVLEAIVFSMC